MDIRQLKYFLAVFEHGSISHAARALGVAPATLSMQLAAMEASLGVSLFARSRGRLAARDLADRLYRLGGPLCEEVDFAVQYLRAGHLQPPHEVTVSAPLAAAGSPLAAQVQQVAAASGYRARIVSEDSAATVQVGYCVGTSRGAGAATRERWLAVEIPSVASVPNRAMFAFAITGAPITGRGLVDHAQRILRVARGHAIPIVDFSSVEFADGRVVCLLPVLAAPPTLLGGAFRSTVLPRSECDPHRTVEVDPKFGRELKALAARMRRSADGERKSRGSVDVGMRALRYFVAVYEAGRIGAAATRLHVVQPAVSMLIAKLERVLEVQLFERNSHGVRPTTAGHLFYDLVQPPLQDLQDLEGQFRGGRYAAVRPLRIGVIPALNENSMLAESLAAAVSAWAPGGRSRLRIVEAYGAQLCRWVRHEMLDLAIVDARPSEGTGQVTSISSEPMVVVSGAAKRLLPAGPITLERLARLPMVLPSERHGIRVLLEECFAETRLPLTPELEIDSMASVLRLIRTEALVTILPVSAVYAQRGDAGLALNRIAHHRMQRTMSVVAGASAQASLGADEFAELFTVALRTALQHVTI